jgi:hypothetical protein
MNIPTPKQAKSAKNWMNSYIHPKHVSLLMKSGIRDYGIVEILGPITSTVEDVMLA